MTTTKSPIDIKTGYPTSSMSFPAVTSYGLPIPYVIPGQVLIQQPTPPRTGVRKCGYCGIEKAEDEVECPMCSGRKTVYE